MEDLVTYTERLPIKPWLEQFSVYLILMLIILGVILSVAFKHATVMPTIVLDGVYGALCSLLCNYFGEKRWLSIASGTDATTLWLAMRAYIREPSKELSNDKLVKLIPGMKNVVLTQKRRLVYSPLLFLIGSALNLMILLTLHNEKALIVPVALFTLFGIGYWNYNLRTIRRFA